jgi:hypothetical protein
MAVAPQPRPPLRLRDGAIAALFLLGATVIMLALTRADVIAYAPQRPLFVLVAALIATASPGPLLRIWDLPGQILLANAAGWCLAVALLGMPSIGATPLLPLILLGFGATFWPREVGTPVPLLGLAIAFAGGGLLCWAVWGML